MDQPSLDMFTTILVVQDKGTNRTEERSRLSPVTLIQLAATKIVKAPKSVDLALDEKPTSEHSRLLANLRDE